MDELCNTKDKDKNALKTGPARGAANKLAVAALRPLLICLVLVGFLGGRGNSLSRRLSPDPGRRRLAALTPVKMARPVAALLLSALAGVDGFGYVDPAYMSGCGSHMDPYLVVLMFWIWCTFVATWPSNF